MSLTPEEEQKIYEEEKVRLKAQEELEQEKKAETVKKARKAWLVGCSPFMAIGLLLVIMFIFEIGKMVQQTRESQVEFIRNYPRSATIDETMYEQWPFTVFSGELTCYPDTQSVTFRTQGVEYALNGTAKAHITSMGVEPVWKDNPNIPGTKINITTIISDGVELCSSNKY